MKSKLSVYENVHLKAAITNIFTDADEMFDKHKAVTERSKDQLVFLSTKVEGGKMR